METTYRNRVWVVDKFQFLFAMVKEIGPLKSARKSPIHEFGCCNIGASDAQGDELTRKQG
jgi:hypothetical protein